MEKVNVAGLSMKGGRKDKFYFCLLEHFPDESRFFLRSLLQVKDEEGVETDEAIRGWIKSFDLTELVVDFPLSQPACLDCKIQCPGINHCPQENVVDVRERIGELLDEDLLLSTENPKKYEQDRNAHDEINFTRDIFEKESYEHLLSRPFRRRLKKGYLPYWNRPLDFWVWYYYYDLLLDFFNNSYDSFGNTSLMTLSRFSYLKRHFPLEFNIYEGNVHINLIELLKLKVLDKNDLLNFGDLELGGLTRKSIIKKIEKELNIFVYDHDCDILTKDPHAFNSFLLAVSGLYLQMGKTHQLPGWLLPDTNFLVPDFRK